MPKQAHPDSQAARVRKYRDAGLSIEAIGIAVGLIPSRVVTILGRSGLIGRRAGGLSLDSQITFARRLLANAPNAEAERAAENLLQSLRKEQATRSKTGQAGGVENPSRPGVEVSTP